MTRLKPYNACPGLTRGICLTFPLIDRDGVMDPAGPKPCAAVQGTTLLVEDLFYNMNTRKQARFACRDLRSGSLMTDCLYNMQALKASSEEFSRILDIMGRYAAYKAGIAFSCKRQVSCVD